MKSIKFALAAILIGLTVGVPAVMATGSAELASETATVVGHSQAVSRADADGRQLAALTPMPIVPHVPPTSVKVPRPHREPPTAHDRWQKVTVMVPTSLGEAADFVTVSANHAGKAAAEKVLQTSTWLNAFVKQMTSPPHMTPVNEIYQPVVPDKMQPVGYQNKRWYLPDGRVKTLTQR